MINRTVKFLIIFSILTVLLVSELCLLAGSAPDDADIKIRQSFTAVTGLPGLSVYSENRIKTAAGPFAPDTGYAGTAYRGAR